MKLYISFCIYRKNWRGFLTPNMVTIHTRTFTQEGYSIRGIFFKRSVFFSKISSIDVNSLLNRVDYTKYYYQSPKTLPIVVNQTECSRFFFKPFMAKRWNQFELHGTQTNMLGIACFWQNLDKWAKYNFDNMSLKQKDVHIEWANTDTPVKKRFKEQQSILCSCRPSFGRGKVHSLVISLKKMQL